MGPDSLPVEVVAAAAAVIAGVVLAVIWDVSHRWRAALRTTAAALCALTAAATALVWVNRQVETYTTWSDLFGASVSRGAVAASSVIPAADGRSSGRLVTFTVVGRASGLALPVIAYLPTAYDTSSTTRFPVIEALHGFPGSPLTWLHRLHAADYLDREIAAGRMAPTVVLFPYITPDPLLDTECTNLVHGPHMETFLTVDVPAAARARFRIRTDRDGWGLIGYSAGGFCATNLALRHPTQYAAAASLSGYAEPGIPIGDGSERTYNNAAWRLTHLPVPAIALYLACARTDAGAMRDTAKLARLAHTPMSTTTSYVGTGGHNDQTWQAMEAPAFDWLSGWIGRPLTGQQEA
jgi:S-formylglutathione hydrolase FrmB